MPVYEPTPYILHGADMRDLEFIPTETLARGRRFVFVFAGANALSYSAEGAQ